MKTLLLSIACLLLNATTMFAQTINDFGSNHYMETKTFVMDGYTYQCDVDQSTQVVHLYNKENKWTYIDHVYRDTGEHYIGPSSLRVTTIIDNPDMTRIAYDIIDHAFTKSMVKTFEDYRLTTTMYLDPDSGKVVEVLFRLTTFSPFAKVPLYIFRNMEVQLKEKISFTPTSEGRKLNYIMLSWGQCPKGISLTPLTPPLPESPGKVVVP